MEYRYNKNYRNYRKSRNAAWDILIENKIDKLPVPIYHICVNMGIDIKWYDGSMGEGFVQYIDDTPTIILSSRIKNEGRSRFTVAHELGHIILAHKNNIDLIRDDPKNPDSKIEQNANIFAARLLAPACVLWGCNARTPEQIMELCNISYTAALYRAERMEELYKRGKFLTSDKEKQVYEQFLPFIDEHMF